MSHQALSWLSLTQGTWCMDYSARDLTSYAGLIRTHNTNGKVLHHFTSVCTYLGWWLKRGPQNRPRPLGLGVVLCRTPPTQEDSHVLGFPATLSPPPWYRRAYTWLRVLCLGKILTAIFCQVKYFAIQVWDSDENLQWSRCSVSPATTPLL